MKNRGSLFNQARCLLILATIFAAFTTELFGSEAAFVRLGSEVDMTEYGPSAALACALLLEAMIKGRKMRGDIAVTGDLNAVDELSRIPELK